MNRIVNIIKKERVNPLFFLTFDAVTISFNENEPLFDNLDMTIPYGNILIIKGRVGTGKSTLLRSIAGVVDLNSGKIVNGSNCVHLNGDKVINGTVGSNDLSYGKSDSISHDISDLNSNNTANNSIDVHNCNDTNAFKNDIKILDSIYLHSSAEFNFVTGYLKDELILSSVLIDEKSDISKFSEFIDRSIYDLSGGELKRLSIMIALEMGRDKVILLDEPLDMLDNKYASLISSEIIEMSKTTPFIIATHDTHFDDYADTIIEVVAE